MTKTETNIFRKCIATNKIFSVSELIRIDFNKQKNIIQLDINKSLNGRGAYFLPTEANWKLIQKNKGLNRTFRINVAREIYEAIDHQIKEAKCLKEIE
ncbi:Putative transciprtional termination factor [Mycoplasmopsis maculosa]|uniref:Transciprtional termination factor n=1 Tax=Mycoplasmopsis maculosa TaxID=114885 RepID=A0A449B4L5_9BACT|nr:YlxR family protein [Mycoplasmopsis maculosa]VEU75530.1 Putative transciprtional termination factor [Mycoplasmopsis maculosa]